MAEDGATPRSVALAVSRQIALCRQQAALAQEGALERASRDLLPRFVRRWWKTSRLQARKIRARLGTGRRGAPASEAERAGGCQAPLTEDVAARRIRRIAATHAACLAAAAAIDGRRKSYRIEPVPERVLYLLHNSMPYNSGGYAVRAHGLLRALRDCGYDVRALLRPGFPQDRFPALAPPPAETLIDHVPYRFFPRPAVDLQRHEVDLYVAGYARQLREQCQAFRPSVIHAASFFRNGLAAAQVGAELGIPVIYELRVLSILGQLPVPGDPSPERRTVLTRASWEFELELEAARKADRVLAITGALRDLLVEHGIDPAKITLLPNGVDCRTFVAGPGSPEIAQAHDLAGRFVIGFIGSIVDYEGLDDLALALSLLPEPLRRRWRLLIVGDGEYRPMLEQVVERLGLRPNIVFAGRVPHARVRDFYAVCDLVVYPRKPWPICEMISPLKPLEPMALGIPVVASDVAALREMIVDGVNGWCFPKGDCQALAGLLGDIIGRQVDTRPIRRGSRRWVERNRDWRQLARPVAELYRQLYLDAGRRTALRAPAAQAACRGAVRSPGRAGDLSRRARPAVRRRHRPGRPHDGAALPGGGGGRCRIPSALPGAPPLRRRGHRDRQAQPCHEPVAGRRTSARRRAVHGHPAERRHPTPPLRRAGGRRHPALSRSARPCGRHPVPDDVGDGARLSGRAFHGRHLPRGAGAPARGPAAAALAELRRVCRGTLLVSVPFREPAPLARFHRIRFDESRLLRAS